MSIGSRDDSHTEHACYHQHTESYAHSALFWLVSVSVSTLDLNYNTNTKHLDNRRDHRRRSVCPLHDDTRACVFECVYSANMPLGTNAHMPIMYPNNCVRGHSCSTSTATNTHTPTKTIRICEMSVCCLRFGGVLRYAAIKRSLVHT